MSTPARPTSRCLASDLTHDWQEAGHLRAASTGSLPVAPYEMAHPLVQKAAEEFPAGVADSAERHREGISGLTNPMWWKLKVNRWRGAVYVDSDGQAWLCAAGLRRAGEQSDFYRQFMADVASRGANYFLPTEMDRQLLAAEQEADDQAITPLFIQWEAQIQAWARTWAESALSSGDVITQRLDAPDGNLLATVEVVVTRSGDESYDVLVDFAPSDFESEDLMHWAEQVFIVSLCPEEQRWSPTYRVPSGRTYSACALSQRDVAMWAAPAASNPGVPLAGKTSHYAHRERLVDAMVDGDAVRALCGTWFVPRQDPEDREVCPTCQMAFSYVPSPQ